MRPEDPRVHDKAGQRRSHTRPHPLILVYAQGGWGPKAKTTLKNHFTVK